MRHQKSGRRFNRDTDARKALMRNLCTSLLESPSGRITTTEARAKELRRWVERLITTAKDGDDRAPQGQRGDLQTRGGGEVVLEPGAEALRAARRIHANHPQGPAIGRRGTDGDHRTSRLTIE